MIVCNIADGLNSGTRKGDLLTEQVQEAAAIPKEPRADAGKGAAAADTAPKAQQAQKPADARERSHFIEDAVKASKNPEAERLKLEIDEIRKQRGRLIGRIKGLRRRLGYKETELVATERQLGLEREADKDGSKRKRIGYLKKQKSIIEFKISTEASSLSKEKELIRRMAEINAQLDESMKLVRLERKLDFVKKDIIQFREELNADNSKMDESDKKLDALYGELRRILGIGRSQQGRQHQPRGAEGHRKKPSQPQEPQGVNLEDIVVIKKK